MNGSNHQNLSILNSNCDRISQPEEEIHLIIETNNEQLRRLPWQRWNFFKDYPLSEMALSGQEYKCHPLSLSPSC